MLFDLGGVLIDCQDFRKLLEWECWTDQLSEVKKRYQSSETVKSYQRGIIGTKEYVESIISELDLTVSVSRYLREFRLLPKGFYPGADVILKDLSRSYITACLSNTNEMHWNKLCSVNKLDKFFKYKFPSHLTHEIKPDKDAYLNVINTLGVDPGSIAFFDDIEENVAAAKAVGIDAYHTDGLKQLCDCISELEIL